MNVHPISDYCLLGWYGVVHDANLFKESLAEWMKDKPLSILQLDPADRAVLRIAGELITIIHCYAIFVVVSYCGDWSLPGKAEEKHFFFSLCFYIDSVGRLLHIN